MGGGGCSGQGRVTPMECPFLEGMWQWDHMRAEQLGLHVVVQGRKPRPSLWVFLVKGCLEKGVRRVFLWGRRRQGSSRASGSFHLQLHHQQLDNDLLPRSLLSFVAKDFSAFDV